MKETSFFYKEIQKGNNTTQRINLQDAFTNALLGDVKFDSPVQPRQVKIK